MSSVAPNLADWLTTDEVAEHYNVPTRVVIRAIREGKIPATKKGWMYLVHESDLPASLAYEPRA